MASSFLKNWHRGSGLNRHQIYVFTVYGNIRPKNITKLSMLNIISENEDYKNSLQHEDKWNVRLGTLMQTAEEKKLRAPEEGAKFRRRRVNLIPCSP